MLETTSFLSPSILQKETMTRLWTVLCMQIHLCQTCGGGKNLLLMSKDGSTEITSLDKFLAVIKCDPDSQVV
jgi:hypothetical protein